MKTTKQCPQCKTIKNISEYGTRRERNNAPKALCKICEHKAVVKYQRSKKGVANVIYNSQRLHSKKRGHRLPEYTKQELKEWLYSQKLFHELYLEWVNSGHKRRLKPSVDRKHDDVHYCMSNIVLITWEENNSKTNTGTYKACHGHKNTNRW